MTWIEQLQQNGIRRVGSPNSGFRYHTAAARPVGPADLERIRLLKIPRGKVINRYFNAVDELNRTASLHPSERALLALLKASGSRSAAAAITRIRRKLPREAPAKAA
jgi:hypothetical protein